MAARRHRAPAALAAALAAGALSVLSGCAYQYDDGLPPLGQRQAVSSSTATPSPSVAADRSRRGQPPHGAATEAPLDQLLGGPALQAWARTALPDASGQSLGTDADSVWPDHPARAMGADAEPGPATLRFACRGIGLSALRVTADGRELLNITFACNRAWGRAVDVPASGRLDVQFSAAGDASSNVAYRLTRP
jgi:hypothetical protein